MSEDIFISCSNEPIYTKSYKVQCSSLQGHEVKIYTECERNLDSTGKDDYYLLSFYLSADGYGARNFIIGIFFGHANMTQQEIDEVIAGWITDHITDELVEDVQTYLKKEELYENWVMESKNNDQ